VAARPVLCVGILVADIFVPPLERLPAAGELLATDDFLTQPGGCAANTAIALRRLDVDVAVCGRVGDDAFGELVLRDLDEHAIDTSAVAVTPGSGTSKTVVLPVRGEDRRFVHTFGANASLTAADIPADLLDVAPVVYVGGYLVLPGLRQAELAERLREARGHGGRVILDVVVPSDERSVSLDAIADLLPLADYFVPNDDEAAVLTGESEPAEQARVLSDGGAYTVVVKLGERGVHVRSGETSFDMPAPQVAVVEPSGAGDAFAAGLAVGILEGWELEQTIRFASAVGASACTALGCWAGVSTRVEADAFAARHPLPALAR
jgi:sugar/nucleoside kinase (ribokinase family)